MFFLIKNISKQIHFSFDLETLRIELKNEKSLEEELVKIFKAIKIKFATDEELMNFISRFEIITKKILKWSYYFNYDNDNIEKHGNGYMTLLILFLKFFKILLTNDIEKEIGRLPIIHLCQILEVGFTVALRIHDESTKQDQVTLNQNFNNSFNHKIDKQDTSDFNHMDFQEKEQQKLGKQEETRNRPDSLFVNHMNFLELIHIVDSMEPQLNSLHEHFNYCWLGSMSRPMQMLTVFMALYSAQWKSIRPNNWFSSKARAKMFTNMVLRVNVDCLKSLWNIPDHLMIRMLTPSFWQSYLVLERSDINFPRQKRWIIDPLCSKIHDLKSRKSTDSLEEADDSIPDYINESYLEKLQKKIRCLILRSKNQMKLKDQSSKTILFHIHGGGFISQSPESHLAYMNDWAKKIPDLPIISIDYSLAPESCYPIALQEILDCYLWLISDSDEIESIFGFKPKQILLCGDSAGGNFSMALMVILSSIHNKIMKKKSSFTISNGNVQNSVEKSNGGSGNQQIDIEIQKHRYPKGLFIFYAPFVVATRISPSRIITSIDGLVPFGTVLNCLSAYLPHFLYSEESDDKNQEKLASGNVNLISNGQNSTKSIQTAEDSSLLSSVFSNPFGSIVELIKMSFNVLNRTALNYQSWLPNFGEIGENSGQPWFRRKNLDLAKCIERMNEFASSPYLSPLLTEQKQLDQFTHVPLYLYPSNFDPFLDDSIEMAKKWRKDKVHLEIIKELPHGFLSLIEMNEEAKRASNTCVKHMKQLISSFN